MTKDEWPELEDLDEEWDWANNRNYTEGEDRSIEGILERLKKLLEAHEQYTGYDRED